MRLVEAVALCYDDRDVAAALKHNHHPPLCPCTLQHHFRNRFDGRGAQKIDLVIVSKGPRPVMVSQHFYLVCK